MASAEGELDVFLLPPCKPQDGLRPWLKVGDAMGRLWEILRELLLCLALLGEEPIFLGDSGPLAAAAGEEVRPGLLLLSLVSETTGNADDRRSAASTAAPVSTPRPSTIVKRTTPRETHVQLIYPAGRK